MKITHSVFFTLKHPLESVEAGQFIENSVEVLSALMEIDYVLM